MKIMICQPMYGKTEEDIRKERQELVEQLESEGHEVENTVFTHAYLTKDRPANCHIGIWALAKSLEVLSQVDCLVCMPGWEKARGCRIEERCAKEYGKYIKYIENL